MKRSEVQVGKIYTAKVSESLVPVRIQRDLSASAFICAFQRWWYAGCPEETKQESSDRYTLSGWGAGLGVEAWGCIASAMSMGQHDDSAYSVRGEFLRSHGQEIPEDARPDLMMMHYGEYGGWA